MSAHKVIDPYWRERKMKRYHVYSRLSRVFGEEIHVGESSVERCLEIIEVAKRVLPLSKDQFNEQYPKQVAEV